jgi:YHS domain-containing protein
MSRTARLASAALALALAATAAAAGESRVLVNRDQNGLALQGYDPVAYFTIGKPTPGDPAITSRHLGATYRFATVEDKRAFDADPGKYAPQFGGYCGYAASIHKLSPISPEFWEILDGRLVLQHNQKAWDAWHQNVGANLAKADQNWPDLVAHNGKPLRQLANLDAAGVALAGYDPVAYFEDGRATVGSEEFTATFNGALYHFVSKAHKDAFEFDPVKYEPQFGGYCAYAASLGQLAPIDPTVFQVLDGRLLLQHDREARDRFNKQPKKNLERADGHWPKLVEKFGR